MQYIKLVNIVSIIGLISVFHLADYVFQLKLGKRDYFFMYLMCITRITFSFLYYKLPHYDKIEHLLFPMMFSSIVFYTVTRKLKISLGWRLTLTFFIIIGSISIFELVEYFLDLLFDWRLQGVFLKILEVMK